MVSFVIWPPRIQGSEWVWGSGMKWSMQPEDSWLAWGCGAEGTDGAESRGEVTAAGERGRCSRWPVPACPVLVLLIWGLMSHRESAPPWLFSFSIMHLFLTIEPLSPGPMDVTALPQIQSWGTLIMPLTTGLFKVPWPLSLSLCVLPTLASARLRSC